MTGRLTFILAISVLLMIYKGFRTVEGSDLQHTTFTRIKIEELARSKTTKDTKDAKLVLLSFPFSLSLQPEQETDRFPLPLFLFKGRKMILNNLERWDTEDPNNLFSTFFFKQIYRDNSCKLRKLHFYFLNHSENKNYAALCLFWWVIKPDCNIYRPLSIPLMFLIMPETCCLQDMILPFIISLINFVDPIALLVYEQLFTYSTNSYHFLQYCIFHGLFILIFCIIPSVYIYIFLLELYS